MVVLLPDVSRREGRRGIVTNPNAPVLLSDAAFLQKNFRRHFVCGKLGYFLFLNVGGNVVKHLGFLDGDIRIIRRTFHVQGCAADGDAWRFVGDMSR